MPGIHYVGTTSKKLKLCFTVSTDGTRLREFKFRHKGGCEYYETIRVSGTARLSGSWPIPSGILRLETDDLSIKGRISGRIASGSARRMWYVPAHVADPGAPVGASSNVTPGPCAGPRVASARDGGRVDAFMGSHSGGTPRTQLGRLAPREDVSLYKKRAGKEPKLFSEVKTGSRGTSVFRSDRPLSP